MVRLLYTDMANRCGNRTPNNWQSGSQQLSFNTFALEGRAEIRE